MNKDKVITKFLIELFELAEEQDIPLKADLTEYGLDSIKAIQLVVNLENYYSIMIDEDDLLLENLCSIEKIINVVDKYLGR